MNNVVLEKIISSIEKVEEYIQAGESFVVEQTPLVVNEIIMWGIAKNVFFVFMWLFVTFLSYSIFNKHEKKCFATKTNDFPLKEFLYIFKYLSLFFLILVFRSIFKLCFVWFAPRLYIISEISKLINGNQ
mgnify:FL=1